MKRIFLLILSIFSGVSTAQIFKTSNNFSLTMEPVIGYASGVENEIIYHSTDKTKKISLLEWDRNLILYGFDLQSQYKAFHFDIGFNTSVRMNCGQMKDSDWMNKAEYEMKTTYSVGDSKALENYDCQIGFGFDLKRNKFLFIEPFIQVQYKFDSFSRGKDAEGWYGQSDYSSDHKDHWWYDAEAKHFPSEYYWSEKKQKYVRQVLGGIDYYKHSFFTWSGLKSGFNAGRFCINFDLMFSPFSYFSSEDTHQAGNIFRFIQYGYLSAAKCGIGVSYQLNDVIVLALKSEILNVKKMKGDLYDEGWHLNKSQPGGSSSSSFTTRFGCKIKVY